MVVVDAIAVVDKDSFHERYERIQIFPETVLPKTGPYGTRGSSVADQVDVVTTHMSRFAIVADEILIGPAQRQLTSTGIAKAPGPQLNGWTIQCGQLGLCDVCPQ